MSCEINFYQYDDQLIRSLAPIIIKILDEKKRVLILCQDEKQEKSLDNELWSYSKTKFIAHASSLNKDFDPARQPVLLSIKAENINNANYLIFLTPPPKNFLNEFSRAFFFFDENLLEKSQELQQSLKPKNIFKKENGKWVK